MGVKFTDLFRLAKELGADCLATGHYVRRVNGTSGPELRRALDPARDQSYFLFATTIEQLSYLRFPLGGMPKPQVRAIAQELGLPFNTRGVVVRSVEQGSPAQRMGLEVGDIILNLNGRDMTDARTFQSIAQNRPDGWQIVLQRGGRTFSSFVSG